MTRTGQIDYTTMRLGTVTLRVNGKAVCRIAKCPKCGRKGEYHPASTYMRQTTPARYHHTARDEGWAVFVEDSCGA